MKSAGFAVVLLLAASAAAARGQAGGTKMEKDVAFGGWAHNVRLSNGEVELIVTTDVGPRVLVYRALDPTGKPGVNVFHVAEADAGKTGGDEWNSFGGHRLWVGPENLTSTYAPDNAPIAFDSVNGSLVLKPANDARYGIQKEMTLTLDPKGTGVTVLHKLTNTGDKPLELAVWCLSVMAPGGREIIPMPAGHPHPGPPKNAKSADDFAADRLMVLWPFFDFTDPRWHFGSSFITLHQDAHRGPTKIGLAHKQGWVAYEVEGTVFIKRFGYEAGKTYPDGGCNFETFTNQDMLEIESLGPLVKLAPGESATHTEKWQLLPNIGMLPNEGVIARELVPRLIAKP